MRSRNNAALKSKKLLINKLFWGRLRFPATGPYLSNSLLPLNVYSVAVNIFPLKRNLVYIVNQDVISMVSKGMIFFFIFLIQKCLKGEEKEGFVQKKRKRKEKADVG